MWPSSAFANSDQTVARSRIRIKNIGIYCPEKINKESGIFQISCNNFSTPCNATNLNKRSAISYSEMNNSANKGGPTD